MPGLIYPSEVLDEIRILEYFNQALYLIEGMILYTCHICLLHIISSNSRLEQTKDF